jgi:hypothetical protein
MQPHAFNPPSHFLSILAICYTVHSILPSSHIHSILLAIFLQSFRPFAMQYIQPSHAAYAFNPRSHFSSILLAICNTAIYYTVHSILCSHIHSIILAIFLQSFWPFTILYIQSPCSHIHSILLAIFLQSFWPFATQYIQSPMQPYSFHTPSHFP